MIRAEVIETVESAAAIADKWDDLAAGGASAIYTSPAWCIPAWVHFPDLGSPLLVLAFDHDDQLVGLLPLTLGRTGATWAGSPLGDEHDVRIRIGQPADEVVAALAGALRRACPRRPIVLPDSRPAGMLAAAFPARPGCAAPVLPLAGSDGEFGTLGCVPGWSRHRRQSLRRSNRQLARLGNVSVETLAAPQQLVDAVPQFFGDRLAAWDARGRLDELPALDRHPSLPRFLADVGCQLAGHGRCLLVHLCLDGHPIAQSLYFRSADAYLMYMTTFRSDMARYGPSHLLLAEVAAKAVHEGVGLIELGRGDEPYKFDHGAVSAYLSDVVLAT